MSNSQRILISLKNLDYFTFGQGGYFSPEYLLQGALGIQFMTKEGQNYLLRGSATLGWQTYRQDATPVFPLENSTAVYSASDTSTFIGALHCRWATIQDQSPNS